MKYTLLPVLLIASIHCIGAQEAHSAALHEPFLQNKTPKKSTVPQTKKWSLCKKIVCGAAALSILVGGGIAVESMALNHPTVPNTPEIPAWLKECKMQEAQINQSMPVSDHLCLYMQLGNIGDCSFVNKTELLPDGLQLYLNKYLFKTIGQAMKMTVRGLKRGACFWPEPRLTINANTQMCMLVKPCKGMSGADSILMSVNKKCFPAACPREPFVNYCSPAEKREIG